MPGKRDKQTDRQTDRQKGDPWCSPRGQLLAPPRHVALQDSDRDRAGASRTQTDGEDGVFVLGKGSSPPPNSHHRLTAPVISSKIKSQNISHTFTLHRSQTHLPSTKSWLFLEHAVVCKALPLLQRHAGSPPLGAQTPAASGLETTGEAEGQSLHSSRF